LNINTAMAITVYLIALLGFPVGCVLDFLGRKRTLPRVPLYLLRVSALGAWVWMACGAYLLISVDWELRPEPLSKQGPDTANARRALVQRFGVASADTFRNAYYFLEPTFTGSPFEFLRFDYPDKADLVRRLADRNVLTPAPPKECNHTDAPPWWPRSTAGISAAFRISTIQRLCLEEANHRAYILVIGH
jgi:hypothetical protein